MRGECHVGQGRYATYTVWDKCTLLHTRTSIHHCTLYSTAMMLLTRLPMMKPRR